MGYELGFAIFLYHINTPFLNWLFFYTCNIGLFYWHFHVLNICLKQTPAKYLKLFILIFTELIIAMAIKLFVDYLHLFHTIQGNKIWSQLKYYGGLDLNRTIQFIYFSTVIWSAINFGWFKRTTTEALIKTTLAEKVNADLKLEFSQAQNAFLKQQINPHLLFNTLNAIYSSVYVHSPEGSKLVLLLSDIMHFSYEDAGAQDKVPLRKEIEHLQNLIELNSYRFHKTVGVELSILGEPNEFSIIPLVLITLTENMFKHGDLRKTPRRLEITISPDGRLRYLSTNVPKPKDTHKKGTNIGLTNTKLRLDYAYPNNYDLNVTETDELFSLELHINLAYERDHH
jgi:sensor histidine kinase YesM